MANRFLQAFTPINSTLPSFDVFIDSTSVATALESTGVRDWAGPTGRSIRISTITADDFRMQLGSTLAAAEANGLMSIGTEINPEYFNIARTAVPELAALACD